MTAETAITPDGGSPKESGAEPDRQVLDRFPDTEWTLRTDRCVAEFAVRLAGLTVVLGWFPALSGRLVLGEGIWLCLDATSPSTDPSPLAARIRSRLGVGRQPEIGFSPLFSTPAGSDRVVVVGELAVAGRKTVIALQARVVRASEQSVVVQGEAYVPLAEVLPGRKQAKQGWRNRPSSLRLTLAAEFTSMREEDE